MISQSAKVLGRTSKPAFSVCTQLVEEAYAHYRNGQMAEGYKKLDEMQKLLKKIPSQ